MANFITPGPARAAGIAARYAGDQCAFVLAQERPIDLRVARDKPQA